MSSEIEDLIRKLEPIKGRTWAEQRLQDYNSGKFSPILKKAVESEVKTLANKHELENQIIIHPVPKRSEVGGQYSLGQCRYGKLPMNARFGLRGHDFIKHVGLFGATGSGKTTTAIQIIRQLCNQGDPFLILDPKGTWQMIIRKPWARNVKVLRLGSSYAPYTLDPFKPLTDQDLDTLVADIVEVFCDSQYLGYGAKSLLQTACYIAQEKESLNLKSVYEAFRGLDTKGYKKSQWAESTERALKTATTGILGRVLNSPDNIPFNNLMNSQVIITMDMLSDHDQIAIFNGLMLNRIYWFRKLAGIKELFKHLLVLEEFHVMSNAEFSKGGSRIDFLIKTCREFSQGVMVIEQNPGKISDAVLGNLNTIISMNLGHTRDINAVGTAMALDAEHKRYLGRLSVGEAICKVKDRLKDSILVKVDHPDEVRKLEPTPEEIQAHNGDFVSEISIITERLKPDIQKEFAQFSREDKLTQLDRKILRFLKINNGANLKATYISHGLSYRRGNTIRNKLERLGYITSESFSTNTGHETKLFLTEKGHLYLQNTEDSRRLGGDWHRSTVERVANFYRKQGFLVQLEYRDIDVFVDKGSETVAVEVESLSSSKDYVHAVSNAVKASRLADRIEIVVKDKTSGKKLKECLKKSPLKNYGGVKIKLISDYVKSIFVQRN